MADIPNADNGRDLLNTKIGTSEEFSCPRKLRLLLKMPNGNAHFFFEEVPETRSGKIEVRSNCFRSHGFRTPNEVECPEYARVFCHDISEGPRALRRSEYRGEFVSPARSSPTLAKYIVR